MFAFYISKLGSVMFSLVAMYSTHEGRMDNTLVCIVLASVFYIIGDVIDRLENIEIILTKQIQLEQAVA